MYLLPIWTGLLGFATKTLKGASGSWKLIKTTKGLLTEKNSQTKPPTTVHMLWCWQKVQAIDVCERNNKVIDSGPSEWNVGVKCLLPPCIILTLFLSWKARAELCWARDSDLLACASNQNASSCVTAVMRRLQGLAAGRCVAAVREVSLG